MTFKFRGMGRDGKYVYGSKHGSATDRTGKKMAAIVTDDNKNVAVKNIALLMAYDVDGNEIYTDDTVILDGKEMDAFPLMLGVNVVPKE